MNWKKVLNSFIILFIILNAFLFGMAMLDAENPYELDDSEKLQLTEILEKNSTVIYDVLPTFEPRAKMQAKSLDYDENELAKKILGEDVKIHETDNAIDYTGEKGTLSFFKVGNPGMFVYTAETPSYLTETQDIDALIKSCKKWIQSFSGKELHYKTLLIKGNSQDLTLEFNQIYNDELAYFNNVQMRFNEKGLVEAVIRQFTIVGFEGKKQPIKPVDEVLYKFMSDMKEQQVESLIISSIRIGYEFGPEAMDEMEGTMEALPYYIIKLSDGDIYYIDAYTNENLTL